MGKALKISEEAHRKLQLLSRRFGMQMKFIVERLIEFLDRLAERDPEEALRLLIVGEAPRTTRRRDDTTTSSRSRQEHVHVTAVSSGDLSMPDYLRDNPWVNILRSRASRG